MLKTAEFVSPKHPDKMCDQISDAILDACLRQDPKARVAVEVMGGHGKVLVMGEVTMTKEIPFVIIEDIVKRITGRDDLQVNINLVQQSPEIAKGVDTGGAGDQGSMTGYACTDNQAMVPQEYNLARALNKYIFEKHPYDGKTQITYDDKNGRIETIVASFQNVSQQELRDTVISWILNSKLAFKDVHSREKIMCNSAGDWKIGGFDGDTGMTGRKIVVDNYGPHIPIGGGCFSGKDATKVDRSGAYMARKIAIDTMRIFKAQRCLINIAYAIGKAEPIMAVAYVTKNGQTSEHPLKPDQIKQFLTPKGMIKFLELDKPQYEETARWGHFGSGKFKWDK